MKRKQGSPLFERWYSIYPRKKAPMVAMKSWERDKLEGDAEEIIAHTELMIANDKAWKEGYAPYPATYLNQQRYFDEPDNTPEWSKLPRDDNDLWDFAKEHNFSNPGSLYHGQYRALLEREIDERMH